MHAEVLGFDLHNAAVSGSGSPWVSTNAVNPPAAPTLTVATAKALVAFTAPETMPLLPAVAASAIMSVTGVAENSRLGMSRPTTSAAGGVPSQMIPSGCENGPVATEDWNASRKLWPPLPAIETGWLGDPVSCPLPVVVWYSNDKVDGAEVGRANLQLLTVLPLAFSTVEANVAGVPTITERLSGRIAAANTEFGGPPCPKKTPNEPGVPGTAMVDDILLVAVVITVTDFAVLLVTNRFTPTVSAVRP